MPAQPEAQLDDGFWRAFLARERLPDGYRELAETWFGPLAAGLIEGHRVRSAGVARLPVGVVGLCGCQGSGKSTLATLLAAWLQAVAGLRVLVLSLDDFYLPRAQRLDLAQTRHPLFATRGVPGTHDISALGQVIRALQSREDRAISLPSFDKAADDRAPSGLDIRADSIDLVLLEGWCVGLLPQPTDELGHPVNRLEREEDPDGVWRTAVNEALTGPYGEVFGLIETLVVLRAPSFDHVLAWRWEQEQKLRARLGEGAAGQAGLMDRPALERFLHFYQRLTEWGLESLPGRADLCFHLQASRGIEGVSGPMAWDPQ